MNKDTVNVEVRETKEAKELAGLSDLSDVEKELLSLGYAVTDRSTGPRGESVVTYTKEALIPDLYEKLLKNASFFSLLRNLEDSLSVSGRYYLFEYNFKGYYTSRVVRSSESGEVILVSNRYTYSFSTDSPYGFSVLVEVSGELDSPVPAKGNPVTCEVRPVIYLGPVPVKKGWKKDVEELVSKISSLFAIRSIRFPGLFPEADVYLILEKTKVVRDREEKTTSTRYFGMAGEAFYDSLPDWSDDEESDEEYEEYDDEDSDFEEEDLDEDELDEEEDLNKNE